MYDVSRSNATPKFGPSSRTSVELVLDVRLDDTVGCWLGCAGEDVALGNLLGREEGARRRGDGPADNLACARGAASRPAGKGRNLFKPLKLLLLRLVEQELVRRALVLPELVAALEQVGASVGPAGPKGAVHPA